MKKKIIIISILIITIVTSIYCWARYVGTSGLKVKEYKISANISDNFNGLKIIHFSDLHYGSTIDKNDLTKIVEKMNFIKPDIVVFTGDLTNKFDSESIDEITSELSKIKVSIGKYAVSGNHDNSEFTDIMAKADFITLNNAYDLIYKDSFDTILLSGITSNLNDTTNVSEKLKDTYEYLEQNTPVYKILLTHEPDIADKVDTFNLVLAGHSHNAQINVPIIRDLYKVNGATKYYKPYYLINNTDLYISGGLGTSKLKLRMFNKPSFNLYRIVKS